MNTPSRTLANALTPCSALTTSVTSASQDTYHVWASPWTSLPLPLYTVQRLLQYFPHDRNRPTWRYMGGAGERLASLNSQWLRDSLRAGVTMRKRLKLVARHPPPPSVRGRPGSPHLCPAARLSRGSFPSASLSSSVYSFFCVRAFRREKCQQGGPEKLAYFSRQDAVLFLRLPLLPLHTSLVLYALPSDPVCSQLYMYSISPLNMKRPQ
jgi:hypothetical protein